VGLCGCFAYESSLCCALCVFNGLGLSLVAFFLFLSHISPLAKDMLCLSLLFRFPAYTNNVRFEDVNRDYLVTMHCNFARDLAYVLLEPK
jgi:hypothetical protein